VRVGSAAITTAEVRHWTAVLSGKRQALEFLIEANWLLQQAEEQRLTPSVHTLTLRTEEDERRRIVETEEPGYEGHRTAADVRLEASAEVASTDIREAVSARVASVTPEQVAVYYRRHRRRFLIPEQRYFDIAEPHSEAAALKLKREVEAGKRFAAVTLHESLARIPPEDPGRVAIHQAIVKARPGVLNGPVLLSDIGVHALFEVTRIVSATYQPLGRVQASLAAQLDAGRRRKALSRFDNAWIKTWKARTNCRSAYVVPACRQYAGVRAPVLYGQI
jgi:hypothetical protein